MLEIRVGKTDCDYFTISEAVQAVPYETPAVIYISEGTYREKIFCEKKDVTFVGAGMDKTILEYGDGAFDEMPDGSKRGTFRSYTAFFGGNRIAVKDMTIVNTAGPGKQAGQALAVYADAAVCSFERVRLDGYQDTLFMAPLPTAERQKNGFMGPRFLGPRLKSSQYYKDCVIAGDVDFIFGGADAVFDDCEIILKGNGYITAPCETPGGLGMVFRRCKVKVTAQDGKGEGRFFLGRPWRDTARAVFLDCVMDDKISPLRFSGWGAEDKDQPETFMGEYRSRDEAGALTDMSGKNPWVRDIDEAGAAENNRAADRLLEMLG